MKERKGMIEKGERKKGGEVKVEGGGLLLFVIFV